MIEVNAEGLSCPLPVVRTMEALKEHSGETIVVLVDEEVARDNVLRLAKMRNLTASVAAAGGGRYRITLTPVTERKANG